MKNILFFWYSFNTFLTLFLCCSPDKSNANLPLQLLLLRAGQNKVSTPSGFLTKLPIGIGLNSTTGNSSSISSSNLNNWDSVRLMPTFLKQVTDNIDNVLNQFFGYGILGKTSLSTQTTDTFKIKFNPAFNGVISSNAYTNTKIFRYSLELWNSSSNQKVLELFYDDAIQRTSGKGSLLIWQPNAFDSNINGNLKVECYTVVIDAQNTTMICSWIDGVFKASGNVDNVLFKMTLNAVTNSYSTQMLARTNANQGISCAGGNLDYYVLAANTNTISGRNYSIAKWGYNDNSIADTECGQSNLTNYAYFDSGININATNSTRYFVSQGITSDTNSYNTGYFPLIQDTSTLFNQIGTASNELTIQKLTSIILSFKGNADPGF